MVLSNPDTMKCTEIKPELLKGKHLQVEQGYIWFSDQPKPQVCSGKTLDWHKDILLDIPHVIEGWLVSTEHSFWVRCIDSIYHIYRFELNAVRAEGSRIHLPAHKYDIHLYEKLEFYTGFETQITQRGMKVNVPTWQVFTGFTN